MTNLINLLNIRNSGRGNAYKFTIKDKDYKAKTLNELVNLLYEKSGAWQAESWYQTEVQEIHKSPNYHSPNDFEQVWKEHFYKLLDESLEAKRDKRDEHQQASLPSAFEAEFVGTRYQPSNYMNDEDYKLIKGIVYCKANDNLYYVENDAYTRIGPFSDMVEKQSDTLMELSALLQRNMAAELGVPKFDLWEYIWSSSNAVTEVFFKMRREIEDCISSGQLPSNCNITFNKKQTTIKQLFGWIDDTFHEDWLDDLHTLCIKFLINEAMPSSLIRNGLVKLQLEMKNNLFKRYNLTGTTLKLCNFNMYLSSLFEGINKLTDLQTIEKEPRIISEDATCAKFHRLKDWHKNLAPNQFGLSECKILNTFLEKYNEDEKDFIMAWAYSVLHPSLGEGIGLLIKTGGGAFKTCGYSTMIKKLLSKMYGGPEDELTYTLIRDAWVKNDQYKESSGNLGISHCALVVNDECTEKCVEQYKDMSGSTSNVGVVYSYKKVYAQPVQTRIYNRWLFLTNHPITIQDADGVYERRLAIIDRMDIKQLKKPYNSNYEPMIDRELGAFYGLAKECYTKLKIKYGDLVSAATSMSFARNLKDAYAEEDKSFIYYKFFEKYNVKDVLEIPCKDFTETAKQFCEENEVNFNGFKNWIKNTDKTVAPCKWNFCKKEKSCVVKYHKLYKLKPEFEPKCEEDTDMDSLNSVCV